MQIPILLDAGKNVVRITRRIRLRSVSTYLASGDILIAIGLRIKTAMFREFVMEGRSGVVGIVVGYPITLALRDRSEGTTVVERELVSMTICENRNQCLCQKLWHL